MEKFAECISEANKKLVFSRHLLEKTYPMVEDPKMLLSVVSNIYYSLRLALLGVLYFELFFKRIKVFSNDLNEQICVFDDFCQERYPDLLGFSKELQSIKKIMDAHKDSSVEFAKNEEVRMFDEMYNSTILSYSDVSDYLSNAKVFIDTLIHNFDIKVVDVS